MNHGSSVVKMKIYVIIEMFLNLEEKYSEKYTMYIENENSKTYKGILKVQLYGRIITMPKKKHVGHLEKRVGT